MLSRYEDQSYDPKIPQKCLVNTVTHLRMGRQGSLEQAGWQDYIHIGVLWVGLRDLASTNKAKE